MALLLFLGFLALLALLGRFAAQATRGPADGRRGCLGSSCLVLVVLFLCGLGVAGLALLATTVMAVGAVRHNPIRSVEFVQSSPRHAEEAPGPTFGRPPEDFMALRFEVEGDVRGLFALLERRFGLDRRDLRLVAEERSGSTTLVELWIPIDARDLDELRRDLAQEGIELPDGLRVRFRDGGFPR
jgi:hypothetical protein